MKKIFRGIALAQSGLVPTKTYINENIGKIATFYDSDD